MANSESFLTSRLTWAAVAARLVFIVKVYPEYVEKWISNAAVQSMVVRPQETAAFLGELHAKKTFFGDSVESLMHNKPLEYAFLSWLLQTMSPVVFSFLLVLVDMTIAWSLVQLGSYIIRQEDQNDEESLQERVPKVIQPKRRYMFAMSLKDKGAVLLRRDFPLLAAQLYFCSPFSVLSSGYYACFQSVEYLAVLLALYQCTRPTGSLSLAAFALAIAGSLSPFLGLVFMIPCVLVLEKNSRSVKPFIYLSCLWSGSLFGLSYLMVGRGIELVKDFPRFSHPNLGTVWYFTMQVFERFRRYFAVMFGGMSYVLTIPLAIRLYRYPVVLATTYWFLYFLFHSHPTLLDLNLGLAFMAISPRSLARTGIPSLIALCAMPVPLALYVLDCWLWLETGSGNANFIYFQCLAHQVFSVVLFLDFVGASLRREKALRLTEKSMSEAGEHDSLEPGN